MLQGVHLFLYQLRLEYSIYSDNARFISPKRISPNAIENFVPMLASKKYKKKKINKNTRVNVQIIPSPADPPYHNFHLSRRYTLYLAKTYIFFPPSTQLPTDERELSGILQTSKLAVPPWLQFWWLSVHHNSSFYSFSYILNASCKWPICYEKFLLLT